MSIHDLRERLAARSRDARTQRELAKALSKAPTPASRQELLALR